jgi:glycolate oxidase iron-sulfur subunit
MSAGDKGVNTSSSRSPPRSNTLRDHKVDNLTAHQPELIATANIGCLHHIQAGSDVPVQHWVNLFDEH